MSTTHPMRPRERAVSDFTELTKAVQAAGLMRRRPGHYTARHRRRRRRDGRAGRHDRARRRLVVAAARRSRRRRGPHPDRVPRPRRRAPPDLELRQGEHLDVAWCSRTCSSACPTAGGSTSTRATTPSPTRSAPTRTSSSRLCPSRPRRAAARTSPLGRWYLNHQGWFFFPLLLLEGLDLHISAIKRLISKEPLEHRAVEAVMIGVRLLGALALVFAVMSPAQGPRVLRDPARPVRLLHGRLVRAEPQGHAAAAQGRPRRLPAPPGAHEPQHPRRPLGRRPDGRPEPPGRAPPVPVDAARRRCAARSRSSRRTARSTTSRTWRSRCRSRTRSSCATSTPSGTRTATCSPARSRRCTAPDARTHGGRVATTSARLVVSPERVTTSSITGRTARPAVTTRGDNDGVDDDGDLPDRSHPPGDLRAPGQPLRPVHVQGPTRGGGAQPAAAPARRAQHRVRRGRRAACAARSSPTGPAAGTRSTSTTGAAPRPSVRRSPGRRHRGRRCAAATPTTSGATTTSGFAVGLEASAGIWADAGFADELDRAARRGAGPRGQGRRQTADRVNPDRTRDRAARDTGPPGRDVHLDSPP